MGDGEETASCLVPPVAFARAQDTEELMFGTVVMSSRCLVKMFGEAGRNRQEVMRKGKFWARLS